MSGMNFKALIEVSEYLSRVRWLLKHLKGLILLLLIPGQLVASTWVSGETRRYSPVSVDLGRITWDITQDHRGLMYFANSKGLYEFDSTSWRLIPFPEPGGPTALLTTGEGRVYVGGNAMIGFLAPDFHGRMIFRSMIDSIPTFSQPPGTVLKILNLDKGGLAFLFEKHLLIYVKGHFNTRTTSGSFYDAVFDGKTLYVLDSDNGLSRLEDSGLSPVPEGNFFRAHAMIALGEGRLMLLTRDKGVLEYNQLLDRSSLSLPP